MKTLRVAALVIAGLLGSRSNLLAQKQCQNPPCRLEVIQAHLDGAVEAVVGIERPGGLIEAFVQNNPMVMVGQLSAEWPLIFGGEPKAIYPNSACLITPKVALEMVNPDVDFIRLRDARGATYTTGTQAGLVAMIGCSSRFSNSERLSWAPSWYKVQVGVGTLLNDPLDGSLERGKLTRGQIDNVRGEAYFKYTLDSLLFARSPILEFGFFALHPMRYREHDPNFPGFDDRGATVTNASGTVTLPLIQVWRAGGPAKFRFEIGSRGELYNQRNISSYTSFTPFAGLGFHLGGDWHFMVRPMYTWRQFDLPPKRGAVPLGHLPDTRSLSGDPEFWSIGFYLQNLKGRPNSCGCTIAAR